MSRPGVLTAPFLLSPSGFPQRNGAAFKQSLRDGFLFLPQQMRE
jgi:hypothetical protein